MDPSPQAAVPLHVTIARLRVQHRWQVDDYAWQRPDRPVRCDIDDHESHRVRRTNRRIRGGRGPASIHIP